MCLPKDQGNLRIVLSTVSDKPLALDPQLTDKHPDIDMVHPTILFVVRKGRGNKRMTERETVPNENHWRQELFVEDRCVKIKNRMGMADIERFTRPQDNLPDVDEMFLLGSDMVLNIGKQQDELNMVLLIPKTEARSSQDEVTINKVMANRLPEPFLIGTLSSYFNKKNSNNVKKLKIKYEVFSMATGDLLMSGVSNSISDSSSREHGILDFARATPLASCEKGGRKIYMISQGQIAQDVEPRFQLYDENGVRLEDKENLLTQPNDRRNPDKKNVIVLKEMIIFITPAQNNIEMIIRNRWKIKLVGIRISDGYESITKFDFDYFPDDYYVPCIFCELQPDGYSSPATLPTPISPARPGSRKRKMDDSGQQGKPTGTSKTMLKVTSDLTGKQELSASKNADKVPPEMPPLTNLYTSPQTSESEKVSVIKFNTQTSHSESLSSHLVGKHLNLVRLLNMGPNPFRSSPTSKQPLSPLKPKIMHAAISKASDSFSFSYTYTSPQEQIPMTVFVQDQARNSLSLSSESSSPTNTNVSIPVIKIEDE